MKNTKKFLSIILAILMIVTTMPMAFAAGGVIEVNGTGFSNFDEAITYVKSLSEPVELKLLDDIDASNSTHNQGSFRSFYWPVNAEKLDLNGYTINFFRYLYFRDVTLTITDTSEQGNGKVRAGSMNMHVSTVEKAYMTLENGTLEARDYNYAAMTVYDNCEFNMTGGSIIKSVASHTDCVLAYDNSVVNISGGTITNKVMEGYSPFALWCYERSTVNITGGTFNDGICAGTNGGKTLIEHVPVGFVIKDENGNYIDKNLYSTDSITVTVEKHINHDYENGVCSVCDYICEHTGGEATCVAKAVCEACGLEYGTIDADNHEIVNVEAKANTCTEIGWDAYEYCTECDYTTYDEKPILGHDIIIDAYVAPKCEETGLTAGQHCSRCDDMTVAQEVIPDFGGHINEDGDTACDRCGETILCKDCGRPVHEDTFIQNLVCLIVMLINLVKTMF